MMATCPLMTLDDRWTTDDDRVHWIDEAVEAVRALAQSRGWTVSDIESSARSFSRYMTLDRGEDETIRVRVSDHNSGMSGQQADEALVGTSRYLGMMWRDLETRLAS